MQRLEDSVTVAASQQEGGSVEEPVWKGHDLHPVGRGARPVIDVSYVELPEKLTHRVNLGSVLGAVSFFSMLLAPAAVEGESYIVAIVLVASCGVCADLSIREDGKRK